MPPLISLEGCYENAWGAAMCCHNPLDSLILPVVRAETGALVWMWAITASPVTMSQTITGFSALTLQRHENGRVTDFTVTPVNTFPGEGGRLRAHKGRPSVDQHLPLNRWLAR